MSGLLCPLCNAKPVVIMTCDECWGLNGEFTTTDKAKIALFDRHAELSEGARAMFNQLKHRHGL